MRLRRLPLGVTTPADRRSRIPGVFTQGCAAEAAPGCARESAQRCRRKDKAMMDTASLADHGPVIPVIVLQRLEHAVPLAEALVAGGVKVLEVTLRTPV